MQDLDRPFEVGQFMESDPLVIPLQAPLLWKRSDFSGCLYPHEPPPRSYLP